MHLVKGPWSYLGGIGNHGGTDVKMRTSRGVLSGRIRIPVKDQDLFAIGCCQCVRVLCCGGEKIAAILNFENLEI